MQYTKPMIELVFEIRKLVPSDMKPGVKLANPNLFYELIDHYHGGAKTVTKALIKELLSLAGEDWEQSLATKKAEPTDSLQTKMYRGLVSLEEKIKQPPQQPNPNQKKRIYRGQVIG